MNTSSDTFSLAEMAITMLLMIVVVADQMLTNGA
jgi:hypothetical protein